MSHFKILDHFLIFFRPCPPLNPQRGEKRGKVPPFGGLGGALNIYNFNGSSYLKGIEPNTTTRF